MEGAGRARVTDEGRGGRAEEHEHAASARRVLVVADAEGWVEEMIQMLLCVQCRKQVLRGVDVYDPRTGLFRKLCRACSDDFLTMLRKENNQ